MYVQYGCGLHAPLTWRNFDSSPTLRLQRLPLAGGLFKRNGYPIFPSNVEYGDIIKGLPLANESCDGIYCEHILEHLALEDCRAALKNTFALLKPSGVFRLVVPDLKEIVQQYSRSGDALWFMNVVQLGRKQRPKGLEGVLRDLLGGSHHLWMWDFRSLENELRCAGFQTIRRAEYGDSANLRFTEVEREGRWQDCLGMEAIK